MWLKWEWDKRRVATEHSLGNRMIGVFNRSVSVAKRRSQSFVPRFDCKYSELQKRLAQCVPAVFLLITEGWKDKRARRHCQIGNKHFQISDTPAPAGRITVLWWDSRSHSTVCDFDSKPTTHVLESPCKIRRPSPADQSYRHSTTILPACAKP